MEPEEPLSPRRALALASCVVLCACAGEPQTDEAAAEEPPQGYIVRLDEGRTDPGQFALTEEADGVHVMTGPAGIAYQAADEVLSGDFRVQASFLVHAAPVGFHEAYGLFVGGRGLTGPNIRYTYLLMRPTGEYLIKQRVGDSTRVLVDWTADDAVHGVEADGEDPRNTLEIEVTSGEARFLVNDHVVHTAPLAEARPFGIAGLRINHRLDVRVSGWSLLEESG